MVNKAAIRLMESHEEFHEEISEIEFLFSSVDHNLIPCIVIIYYM